MLEQTRPALGIDFGGTQIKVGVFDGPTLLAARDFPTTATVRDLGRVSDAVRSMLDELSPDPVQLAGVGIAVPGAVDRNRGCLVAAHGKYGYAVDLDLCGWAMSSFGAPAAIENDSRAALLGEWTYGCAAGERDVVLVILGTGIGTAALMDGKLVRGAHDHGGILGGHMTVDLDGPLCNCGNIGCAEAVASTWALERAIRAHPGLPESPWWIERLARGELELADLFEHPDDTVSKDTVDLFVRSWSAAIRGMCHAYDPELVVVSGGVMLAAERLLPALTTQVQDHLWSSSYRPRLVCPADPRGSVLLGLSVLALGAEAP